MVRCVSLDILSNSIKSFVESNYTSLTQFNNYSTNFSDFIDTYYYTKTQINNLFTVNASPPVDVNSYLVNYYTKTESNSLYYNKTSSTSFGYPFSYNFNSTAIIQPVINHGFAMGTGDGYSHTVFNMAIYSWWSIGFCCGIGESFRTEAKIIMDVREGHLSCKGEVNSYQFLLP